MDFRIMQCVAGTERYKLTVHDLTTGRSTRLTASSLASVPEPEQEETQEDEESDDYEEEFDYDITNKQKANEGSVESP